MIGDASPAALTKATTVAELVATFQAAVADIRAAFRAIEAVEHRLNTTFALGGNAFRVQPSGHHTANWHSADDAIAELNRQAWGVIVDRMELRRLLSVARWDALQRRLSNRPWAEDESLPPITVDNVRSFVAEYATDMGTHFGEAVHEVFDWLRPRGGTQSADYKTNQRNARLEVGPRVVLTYTVRSAYGRGRFQATDWSSQRLRAMENVFMLLDGAGAGTRGHYSDLENALMASSTGAGETPYFEFRGFKNGNLHLRFKRLDLLARFNQIAGGARLRPGAEPA